MRRAPIDVDRVVTLTLAGWSARRIATELDCDERTVRRARSRAGVARPSGRPFTDEELRTAESMLADGASVCEIERTLGRAAGTLGPRFRGRGWTRQQTAEFAGACSRYARLQRRRR